MRRTIAIVAMIGLVLVQVACGSSGEEGAQAKEPATESGLRDAALSSAEAVFKSDGPASYAYLSSECKAKFGVADWSANLAATMALAEGFMKLNLADAKIDKVDTRSVTESSGEVSLTVLTADGEPLSNDVSWKRWVYEDGGWRTTDCEKLGESSASASSSSGTSDPSYEDIQVVESGFSILPAEPGSPPRATYAVVVKNPNPDVAASSVDLNLTFYDTAGGVVKSEDVTTGAVLPSGQAAAANATDAPGASRMTVQAKVSRWKSASSTGSLGVSSTTTRNGSYGGSEINGIVTSTWKSPVSAEIVVVFRDAGGKPLGGTFTYTNDIPASGQQSFNISTLTTIPPDWTPTFYPSPTSLPS